MSFFVPTKFVWRFGGSQVHLCGSFTRWVETVPMTPVEGQAGTFSVVVHLPPGYHQYKFIVDGEWRHDETQPFMPDPLGNVNNWLFVRKPEPTAPAGQTPVAQVPQQHHQQQHQMSQPPGVPSNQVQSNNAATPAIQPPPDASQAKGGPPSTVGTPPVGDGVIAPLAQQVDEPQYTRRKIREFLSHHSAYELIPESGKVVLLDVDLPLRQAFHALHEQGMASAPLFDSETATVCGIVSASDFITTLQRLRSMVSSSSNPMSEAEMDQHTIRGLREELAAEGRPPKSLVSVSPADSLAAVVRTLFENHCSMAPVLYVPPDAHGNGPEVLHLATLSGVLACLMRHFRASLASLPLLAQPLHVLPLGTWAPDSIVAAAAAAEQNSGVPPAEERRDRRRIAPIHTITNRTPLTEALGLLLEIGISCLPVVDEAGALVDIYARADITNLVKANAYSRLQFEDVTVGQALSLAAQPTPPAMLAHSGSQQWGGQSPSSSVASMQDALQAVHRQRVHVCTPQDALRSVVERLSVPGVRRLIVVNAETRKVEGIVSLSDVAAFMLL